MKTYRITATSKKHFDSLIKDYRAAGYMIITYAKRLVELEKGDSLIVIEY